MKRISTLLALPFTLLPGLASAATLCVTSWNLESGDSQQSAIETIVRAHADCDLWGFSEVAGPSVLAGIEDAIQDVTTRSISWVISNTARFGPDGQPDFQAIAFDEKTLTLERIEEIYHLKLGKGRSPLIGHFRHNETGQPISVMVNHLHRSNSTKRRVQAAALAEIGRQASTPWIALGDYNVDWTISTQSGNDAFDELTAVWKWIEPSPLKGTTCFVSGGVLAPGILDLVLVAGSSITWQATSEVIEDAPSYCPDGATKPDHLPVRAVFTF
jgi:endonuclease/exonuclease/phosphatase family metal-dependent hydrolase